MMSAIAHVPSRRIAARGLSCSFERWLVSDEAGAFGASLRRARIAAGDRHAAELLFRRLRQTPSTAGWLTARRRGSGCVGYGRHLEGYVVDCALPFYS